MQNASIYTYEVVTCYDRFHQEKLSTDIRLPFFLLYFLGLTFFPTSSSSSTLLGHFNTWEEVPLFPLPSPCSYSHCFKLVETIFNKMGAIKYPRFISKGESQTHECCKSSRVVSWLVYLTLSPSPLPLFPFEDIFLCVRVWWNWDVLKVTLEFFSLFIRNGKIPIALTYEWRLMWCNTFLVENFFSFSSSGLLWWIKKLSFNHFFRRKKIQRSKSYSFM